MMLRPIGVVHPPCRTRAEAPRQGRFGAAVSELGIYEECVDGLLLLKKNRYLIVPGFISRTGHAPSSASTAAGRARRLCNPVSRSTKSPLAMSVVKLPGIEENRLKVQWLDAIDGTPLLDIKPYSRDLDCVEEEEDSIEMEISR